MTGFIATAARLVAASARAYERKWSFLSVSIVVLLASIIVLAKYDLLPEPSRASAEPVSPVIALSSSAKSATSAPVVVVEEPVKIEIEKIGLVANIANPTTTNIKALDEYLLKGAARYPTSAKLGEAGNVVLFGHSSYLPVVGNQAYKAFNGIQKLVAGDIITVYSANAAYTYRVRTMEKESAESGAGISLAVTGRVLTLATCNSFATKSDRFVVTADFVESHLTSTR
ncbi:MAG: sortase [Minisyncoccia bacterium]